MAFDSIYTTAGSALQAQTIRLNTVASNMANADTLASSAEEAFRAIKPVFGARYRALEGSGGWPALMCRCSVWCSRTAPSSVAMNRATHSPTPKDTSGTPTSIWWKSMST